MSVLPIVDRLGGVNVVGDLRSDLDLTRARAVQHGFSIEAVDALFALGDATPEELHLLVGDPDALVFHERKDEALSPAESDRLARVARVIDLSETVFGKREKARRWLRKANHGLGGHVPWSLLRTEVGGRIVERALTGLAHGVIA